MSRHVQSERIVAKLTKGSIAKSIFSIAIPMIISNTFGIAIELIDAFFVGRLGSNALAAVSLAGVVIFFIATFGIGLGIGVIALVSRAFGSRDFEQADRVVIQAFYLTVALSVLLTITGIASSSGLLRFLGAEGNVLYTSTIYLRILFAGIITMFLMFVGNAVFQAIGDTITSMKIWGITVGINIVLDPIMIFGLWGCPRLEVSGAAYATVISRIIGSTLMIYMLFKGKRLIHINSAYAKLDFAIIKNIFVIGVPGSLQMILRSFSMVVLMKIVAVFGTVVVAAYGVGGRLFHLFLFPGFGFGGAAATLTGQNLGAENPKRAVKASVLSTLYYLVFLLISGIVIFIFSAEIAAIFNPEKEFVEVASVLFRYIAVAAVFLSTAVVFSRSLQGAGKTVPPMLATAASLYIIQIPAALMLSNHLNLKETGIWLANIIGMCSHGIIMSMLFYKFFHRRVTEK